MTKKELFELLNQYPDDAQIEINDERAWGDTYKLEKENVDYDEKTNKIILY